MRNRNADCSRHEKVIAKIWPNAHLDATRQALGTRDVESRMKKLVGVFRAIRLLLKIC